MNHGYTQRLAKTLEIRVHLLQTQARRIGMVPSAPSPDLYEFAKPSIETRHRSSSREPPAIRSRRFSNCSSSSARSRFEDCTSEASSRKSSLASSTGSASMVESRSLPPVRESSPTTPQSIASLLCSPGAENARQNAANGKRKASTQDSTAEAQPKRARSDSNKSLSRARQVSVESSHSRSSVTSRATNGLEMLLNAAEVHQ